MGSIISKFLGGGGGGGGGKGGIPFFSDNSSPLFSLDGFKNMISPFFSMSDTKPQGGVLGYSGQPNPPPLISGKHSRGGSEFEGLSTNDGDQLWKDISDIPDFDGTVSGARQKMKMKTIFPIPGQEVEQIVLPGSLELSDNSSERRRLQLETELEKRKLLRKLKQDEEKLKHTGGNNVVKPGDEADASILNKIKDEETKINNNLDEKMKESLSKLDNNLVTLGEKHKNLIDEEKASLKKKEDELKEMIKKKIPTSIDGDYFPPEDGKTHDVTLADDGKLLSNIGGGNQKNVVNATDGDLPKHDIAKPTGGSTYTDEDFGLEAAMAGLLQNSMKWQRPEEFLPAPKLYTAGSSRFDIQQGVFGDCYFLSVISALGDKPDILGKVIPKDSYHGDQGYFSCSFWYMGDFHKVYIDNFLPTINNSLAGVHSPMEDELWPGLLEKAFAKFWGSYETIVGGEPGDAFVLLTGGVTEIVDLAPYRKKESALVDLHSRIKYSVAGGAVVASSVPADMDNVNGLIGGHAYTITGASRINHRSGFEVLVRIRNPWGIGQGEWSGDWSDKSPLWGKIDAQIADEIKLNKKEDGEFWINMRDFCKHFNNVQFCSIFPDRLVNNKQESIRESVTIISEWKGISAAGPGSLKNPKFLVKLSPKAAESDGLCTVVIQLMQDKTDDGEREYLSTRTDIYSVCGWKDNKVVLDDVTEDVVYWQDFCRTIRARVPPGELLLVPNAIKAGQERRFMIRVFSHCLCSVTPVKKELEAFIGNCYPKIDIQNRIFNVGHKNTFFGEWKYALNAGGQVGHKSCFENPQYVLTCTKTTDSLLGLRVTLMQLNASQYQPIGFNIYKIDKRFEVPLSLNSLYTIHESRIKGQFIQGPFAEGIYALPSGVYVIFIHMDSPEMEANYSICIQTSEKASIKPYNIV